MDNARFIHHVVEPFEHLRRTDVDQFPDANDDQRGEVAPIPIHDVRRRCRRLSLRRVAGDVIWILFDQVGQHFEQCLEIVHIVVRIDDPLAEKIDDPVRVDFVLVTDQLNDVGSGFQVDVVEDLLLNEGEIIVDQEMKIEMIEIGSGSFGFQQKRDQGKHLLENTRSIEIVVVRQTDGVQRNDVVVHRIAGHQQIRVRLVLLVGTGVSVVRVVQIIRRRLFRLPTSMQHVEDQQLLNAETIEEKVTFVHTVASEVVKKHEILRHVTNRQTSTAFTENG